MDPYDSWLCGGALVTPTQILTSAACIIDIENMYAIAGYRYYVNGHDINNDNCTRVKKQRIIKIRVPREHIRHISDYQNSTGWMTLDVGVATVERPYDFEDVTYRIYCSYIPGPIEINYDVHLDETIDTSVVALGWGRDKGSLPGEVSNRNSETLNEVSLQIKNKSYCIEKFVGNGLTDMIKNFMLCTYDKGLLDAGGFVIEEVDKKLINKCDNAGECNEGGKILNIPVLRNNRPKRIIKTTITTKKQSMKQSKKDNDPRNSKRLKPTRRQGICQNDHGGPLITWVGSTELLVGVAVNSLYDANLECVGPYLFTSTAAAGKVIRCLLSTEDPARRSCTEDNLSVTESLVKHSKETPGQDDKKTIQSRSWIREMEKTRDKAPNTALNKTTVTANTEVITETDVDITVELPDGPKGTFEVAKKEEPKSTETFRVLNENRGMNDPEESEEDGLSSIEVITI